MYGTSNVYGLTVDNGKDAHGRQFSSGHPNSSQKWSPFYQRRNHDGFGGFEMGEIREDQTNSNYSPNIVHKQKMSQQQMQSKMCKDKTSKPLTKQVDQLLYELPQQNKFSINSLCQPPEFLKVFSDVRCLVGEKAVFDCVLLGSPRPRVCWLFNDDKLLFDDILLEDTSDICRCTIKRVRPRHYGIYSILAENEVGRAITTATLLPVSVYDNADNYCI
ncbi:hypothetical protein niasHS_002409 [Heterodera schachtii]|uniref:Ig-like domain-containing protein n=1 Tax=Heterodera schachtii TaxID=97005 RepID=A0ABD2KKC5_HETSC